MSFFEYYETKADGTPSEQPRNIDYADRRILFLRWKWSRVDMQHFIDLACAVPGTPVDVTHWEKGQLVYSARMTYKLEGMLENVDPLSCSACNSTLKQCVEGAFKCCQKCTHENAPPDRTAARIV